MARPRAGSPSPAAAQAARADERDANLLASFSRLNLLLGSDTFIGVPFLIERRGDLLRLEMIEAQVRGDAPHPRTELAFEIELTEAIIRAYERLLRQVFGFAALVQDAITDVEHARLVARDEFAERAAVTATGADNQVAVGGRGHG